MRHLVYYVGTTLDGYLAGPGDEFDFLPVSHQMTAWIGERFPETIPTHARASPGLDDAPNQRFDTVLMGRRTYQPALDHGITQPYAHLRQVVVSSTLRSPDPAVEVVTDDPLTRVRDLKADDGLDVWLCGGGVLAGVLLPEIDEIVLKRYPVVAGGGRPVVDGPFSPTSFRPVESVPLDDGALVTRLVRQAAR